MNKPKRSYLAEFTVDGNEKSNPTILRIILSTEYTRIDFGYLAPWIYVKGGWIKIAQHTYLKVRGDKKRYALIDAKGIPIAPEKLHFESIIDRQVFSLFFQPFPIRDCVIDIVEEENPTENDFNIESIRIHNIGGVELVNE